MGMMHVRKPKNFVLEERLERYAAAIEQDSANMRGKRRAAYCGGVASVGSTQSASPDGLPGDSREHANSAGSESNNTSTPLPNRDPDGASGKSPAAPMRIHVDLGCGKGDGLVRMAQEHPEIFFIGVDQEPICIAYAAQKLCEVGIKNALCTICTADKLGDFFAPGEIDELTINFPTPQPKKRNAHLRLVHADKLVSYRGLLAEGATLTFRTDSKPLWLYAQTQFGPAGYNTLWTSENTRADHPECPETEYEKRTVAKGAQIYGICATPLPGEPTKDQLEAAYQANQSLVSYLPENLDDLDYVPIGMEDTVFNMRNRAKKGKTHLPN